MLRFNTNVSTDLIVNQEKKNTTDSTMKYRSKSRMECMYASFDDCSFYLIRNGAHMLTDGQTEK